MKPSVQLFSFTLKKLNERKRVCWGNDAQLGLPFLSLDFNQDNLTAIRRNDHYFSGLPMYISLDILPVVRSYQHLHLTISNALSKRINILLVHN